MLTNVNLIEKIIINILGSNMITMLTKSIIKPEEKETQKIRLLEKQIEENLQKIAIEKDKADKTMRLIKQEETKVHQTQNSICNITNISMTELDLRKSMLSNPSKTLKVPVRQPLRQQKLDDILNQKERQIRKHLVAQQNKEMIKFLKAKTELLGRLMEVKTQGGYYNAHKRVVLKQLVELIRKSNKELEQATKQEPTIKERFQQAKKKLGRIKKEVMSYHELDSKQGQLIDKQSN